MFFIQRKQEKIESWLFWQTECGGVSARDKIAMFITTTFYLEFLMKRYYFV